MQIKIFFLLLLLLLLLCSSSTAWPVGYRSACGSLCGPYMNGICGVPGRCMCNSTQYLDDSLWYRCTYNNSIVPMQSITHGITLTYSDADQNGRVALANATQICYPNHCTWNTSRVFALVYNASTNVPFASIDWLCLNGTGVMRNADLSANDPPLGYHTLDYSCITDPTLFCNPSTTANITLSMGVCNCITGYTGNQCTTVIAPLSVLTLWYQDQFLLNSTIYNAGRVCTSNTDCTIGTELCYQDLLDPSGSSYCYCAPGAYPMAGQVCVFVPMASLIGVWVPTLFTFVTIHYIISDPLMLWYTLPNGTIRAAYSQIPASQNATVYRFTTSDMHYQVIVTSVTSNTSNETCPNNCTGYHGQCSSITGTCNCLRRWLGASCDLYDLTCANSICSGNGICFANLTGQCTTGYGLNCSYNASECANSRCSGNGECSDPYQTCTCNDWWSGFDCSQGSCAHANDIWTGTQCRCANASRWYGLHCELQYCNGHGSNNNLLTDTCLCDPTWTGSQCSIDQCIPGNRSLTNLTCAYCPYPYTLNASHTACILQCQHNSVYNFTTQTCQCPTAWISGLFCEIVYVPVPTPDGYASGMAVTLMMVLIFMILVILVLFTAFVYKHTHVKAD